jgi:predicted PurR-regulated permease PerM
VLRNFGAHLLHRLSDIGFAFMALFFFYKVPSAVQWAAATGVLAIIPFGAPPAFLAVSGLLLANGHTGAGTGVTVAGMVGLFIGPVVMTLFVTLWHEEKVFGPGVRPARCDACSARSADAGQISAR